jgi:hypothetical protein
MNKGRFKEMKRFFMVPIIAILALMLCSSGVAYAQEAEATLPDPGILPDSPFYFAKSWGRAIHLLFTFDNLEKAELELRFANEDALAIEKLCEKGKNELAEKHCEKFQERFQRAIQSMEKAKQEGKDVEVLVEKFNENHLRQQQVLARVLEKVPEQAKEGVLNAIANSASGWENAIERIQGKHKMEQFREELNLQIRNMGEETRLEIQERLERKRHKPEEVPVGEPKQKEPSQSTQSTGTDNVTPTQTGQGGSSGGSQ